MIGMGGAELVLLLGLFAGGGSLDVVSSLPAKDYLKFRKVELKADPLMELAAQAPEDGKKQIGQLMALSALAQDPGLLRMSDNFAKHKVTLAEIAIGKTAADKQGFAADYAKKVLDALDGRKPPVPEKRSWKDTVKLLPKDATVVGVVDFVGPTRKLPGLDSIFGQMPENEKAGFWSAVEKLGNVRIDSFSMSISPAANGKPSAVVARFTGRANPQGILDALGDSYSELRGNVDRKTPAGEPYRLFRGNNSSAMAIIGDSELILGGYPSELNAGAGKNVLHEEAIINAIAQRGKDNGPLDGALKADLARVPDDASALVVGSLLANMRNPALPMPDTILVHARRAVGGVDLVVNGTMANEDAAKELVLAVSGGRDLALKELVKLQGMPIPGLPPEININSVIGLMESVQLESKGPDAQMRVLIPDETLNILPLAMLVPMRAVGRAPVNPPPPVPVEKVKPEKK